MKFSEIPAFLGITATYLAEISGIPKQTLNQYIKGVRGKNSTVVSTVCAVANINREEIFFSNPFDHPDSDNPKKPAYWLALALEGIYQAEQRGFDPGDLAKKIKEMYYEEKN